MLFVTLVSFAQSSGTATPPFGFVAVLLHVFVSERRSNFPLLQNSRKSRMRELFLQAPNQDEIGTQTINLRHRRRPMTILISARGFLKRAFLKSLQTPFTSFEMHFLDGRFGQAMKWFRFQNIQILSSLQNNNLDTMLYRPFFVNGMYYFTRLFCTDFSASELFITLQKLYIKSNRWEGRGGRQLMQSGIWIPFSLCSFCI